MAADTSPAGDSPSLSREEFAERLSGSYRAFWLTAAGILGEPALSEDVVQEAAIIALRKLDAFAPGTNFHAWMGRIVRNVALNEARKRRRRGEQGLSDATLAAAADRSVVVADEANDDGGQLSASAGRLSQDQVHFDDRVMQALGSVGETARACLLLRLIEGLDYREISALLEIPQGTAMSHVHRARRHLREQLRDLQPRATQREEGS